MHGRYKKLSNQQHQKRKNPTEGRKNTERDERRGGMEGCK